MAWRSRKDRGLALLAVLWIGMVLGLLAAMTLGRSGTDLRLARNVAAAASAEAAADGAVRLAIAELAATPDAWDDERRVRIGEVPVTVSIENEFARVDLNAADETLLAALMIEVGAGDEEAATLAARIADFRDDDAAPRRLGAEEPDYRAARHPGSPKNGAFESVAELAGVLGMTPEIERRLRPHLTVHTGLPEPSPGLAVTEAAVRRSEAMKAERGEERRRTRLVVTSAGAEPTRLYRITADARGEGGGAFTRVAVVQIGRRVPDGYDVFEWSRRW